MQSLLNLTNPNPKCLMLLYLDSYGSYTFNKVTNLKRYSKIQRDAEQHKNRRNTASV